MDGPHVSIKNRNGNKQKQKKKDSHSTATNGGRRQTISQDGSREKNEEFF